MNASADVQARIVLASGGSDEAKTANEQIPRLFGPSAAVTVLSVWQPFVKTRRA